MSLQDFLRQITLVKRAYVQGKGMAPHKPILLLSLADWFGLHAPEENFLPFDEDLNRLFKENWNLLVENYPYSSDLITKPYFYLKNDGFWMPTIHNVPMHGEVRSLKRLYEDQAAASLSGDAFRFYRNPVDRELIRMKLLDAFFPYTKLRYIEARGMDGLILDIDADILMEPSTAPRYGKTITGIKEKEGFIRDQKFHDLLLYIYDYTCCISGLRVWDATMVDACHIKPHALCGINSLDNGLALCPNLHRAFDLGLISLTDDYHVLVKKDLKENDTCYGLHVLDGRKIRLPKEERFWPGREWVRWQRGRCGWYRKENVL
ncbi:MAG: HNH endonuclease [Saprospiraceae bacterium]